MKKAKVQKKKTAPNIKAEPRHHMELPFGRENYLLLGASFLLVIFGFILMYPGETEDIYSFRLITLSPIIVLAGFALGIYAIRKKSKD